MSNNNTTFAGIDLSKLTDKEFSQFADGFMVWDEAEQDWIQFPVDTRENFVKHCNMYFTDIFSQQNFREYFRTKEWKNS